MPYTNFMAAGGPGGARGRASSRWPQQRRRHAPARPADHRRGLRRGRGVPGVGPRREHHRRAAARSTAGTWPDDAAVERAPPTARPRAHPRAVRPAQQLQRVHRRRLHRRPVPGVAPAARAGPVHEGIVHELTGYDGTAFFQGLPYPDRPHFSAFSYEACDAAFRDDELFASSPADERVDTTEPTARHNSMLSWTAPSTAATARWCSRRSCRPRRSGGSATGSSDTVHALIDSFVDDGRAELNVDFCAAIPVLTITGSFGVPRRAGARHPRARSSATRTAIVDDPGADRRRPARATRRTTSSACWSRPRSPTRTASPTASPTPRSTRSRSCCSPPARARRGSRWASPSPRCSSGPSVLDAVRDDRALLRPAIEESLRWAPTDPMFSPLRHRATSSSTASHLPQGAVLHLCLGAANRDPARWDRPDEYDITRPPKPALGVRQRAARLPGHARRPGRDDRRHRRAARPAARTCASTPTPSRPAFIGMYERGATAIPVVFDGDRSSE